MTDDTMNFRGLLGQVSLQLVQLRCRAAMQWPINSRLDTMASGTQKPGKPNRHFTEQRRDPMRPPVLHVASPATGSAVRAKPPMVAGLTGNDRSLNARQKLLRLGHAQTQVRDPRKTFRPEDLHQVNAPRTGIIVCLNQPQHPPRPSPSSRSLTRLIVPIRSASPQSLDTPSAYRGQRPLQGYRIKPPSRRISTPGVNWFTGSTAPMEYAECVFRGHNKNSRGVLQISTEAARRYG